MQILQALSLIISLIPKLIQVYREVRKELDHKQVKAKVKEFKNEKDAQERAKDVVSILNR